MFQIVSIHSFRRGTGKSNLSANIAVALAAEGRRVGVVDADLQSPGIHHLFGFDESRHPYSLNDYLWGRCDVAQTVWDVTPSLDGNVAGRLFFVPASSDVGELTRGLSHSYAVDLFSDGCYELGEALRLDVLVIDTHAGLHREALMSVAISDALAIVMRLDGQDYMGTAMLLDVAHKLEVPRSLLVVNKVLSLFDPGDVKERIAQTYHCDVAAVLPLLPEMALLASSGLFVLRYPDHPVTAALKRVAEMLVGE